MRKTIVAAIGLTFAALAINFLVATKGPDWLPAAARPENPEPAMAEEVVYCVPAELAEEADTSELTFYAPMSDLVKTIPPTESPSSAPRHAVYRVRLPPPLPASDSPSATLERKP